MTDPDRMRHADTGVPDPVEPPAEPPAGRVPWVALTVALVAILGLVWWWDPWASPSSSDRAGQRRDTTVPSSAAEPLALGRGPADADLPPLGALDDFVRPLIGALSARPELAALLASDNLVRRFAVSVEAIARGASPAAQVRSVAPRTAFSVGQVGSATVIDPASFDRYDGLVTTVEQLDPQQMADIYGRLKPRLEEAYAELGVSGTFDQAMERALRHLLETPDLRPPVAVKPAKGLNYMYADPSVEGLSAAQRQLLRVGPDNAARIKRSLRALALALGVSADRLPPNP